MRPTLTAPRLALLALTLTLAGCTSAAVPDALDRVHVEVEKRAVPAAAGPVDEKAPGPPVVDEPPDSESVDAAARTGALTLPAIGFAATLTEVIHPDANGVVRPTSRDGLARVEAGNVRGLLFAVHSGGPAASGPGAALTVDDPSELIGAKGWLPDGTPVLVTGAYVANKTDTLTRLDSVLANRDGIALVTCQVERGAHANHNVVLILERT